MSTWARTGPVVIEIDGSDEALRVVDYGCLEALRSGSTLLLVAPYLSRPAYASPNRPEYGEMFTPDRLPSPAAELADESLRTAVAYVRERYGYGLRINARAKEGIRRRVLVEAARQARMLIVGRNRARRTDRLIAAQGNLVLAGQAGCPVVVVPLSWTASSAPRKVAVGIDGTALSAEALEFAFRSAAESEGELMVLHAGFPTGRVRGDRDEDADEAWLCRADLTLSEAVDEWTGQVPEVHVTGCLTSRPAADALAQESRGAGLVVLGCHLAAAPITDPVALRSMAAITCPVAIVPHHPTATKREHLQSSGAGRRQR